MPVYFVPVDVFFVAEFMIPWQFPLLGIITSVVYVFRGLDRVVLDTAVIQLSIPFPIGRSLIVFAL